MEVNNYKSKQEEKFSDVISALKSLPKVKAEDNFEFNLMTRINNKNFEMHTPEKVFFIKRVFAPAAALAFSVLIVFFLVNDPGGNIENPFLMEPTMRQDFSAVKSDTIELRSSSENLALTEQSQNIVSQTTNSGVVRVVVQPSDAVTIETVQLPFSDENAVDLDSFVSGESENGRANLNRGSLVSGGNSASRFDGFLISERPSKECIESHKARLDSLKKLQEK